MRWRPVSVVLAVLVGCGPTASQGEGTADGSGSSGAGGSTGPGGTTSASGDATAGECPELIVHDGTVVITSAEEIPLYDCFVEITGGLEFEGVEMVELGGFPRLERVGGFVFVAWTATLVSITGFPELRRVGSLAIYEHDGLERIDGFGKLDTVDDSLRLEGLPKLVAVDGLAGVTSVGKWLFLRHLSALPDLGAFASITQVGESLDVAGCDALVDLAGLAGIAPLPDTGIHENEGLLALTGLAASSAYELEIVDNDALVDLSALAQLEVVENSLHIAGNGALASLAGLETLELVGGDLEIVDNDALTQILEPRIPLSVVGHVQICENGLLADLPEPLSASVGEVSLIRNLSLTNEEALAFATALGHPEAKIAGNADLASYPVDPCPFVDDGVCDEPERSSGDLVYVCSPRTGEGCCEWGGPTGLCVPESEGQPDCPPGGGPPG